MSEKETAGKKTNQIGNQLVGSRAVVVEMVLADASTNEDRCSPVPPTSAPAVKKETQGLTKAALKTENWEGRNLRSTMADWKAKVTARRNEPPAITIQNQRAGGSAENMKTKKQKTSDKLHNDIVVSTDFSVMDLVHDRAALANNEDSERTGTDTVDPPSAHSEPGAFMGAPGRRSLHRRDNIRFSLVGVGTDRESPTTLEDGGAEEDDVQEDVTNQNEINTDHNTVSLAEATPVEDNVAPDLEAQPFDMDESERRKSLEAWKHRAKMGLMATLAMAVVATVVGLLLRNKRDSNVVVHIETPTTTSPTMSPSPSPSKPLPPRMDNLEILYEGLLPDKTKESLYNKDSSQYKAWEWLLNHPKIGTFEEWRKRQIFAMATFFYSFGGPSWTKETPAASRWMNASISECDWVLSDAEVAHWTQMSFVVLGPGAYEPQDFQPCNEEGKLQTLFVSQLLLPTYENLAFPPEIGLLTSLKILGIGWSAIKAELSDLLLPEVVGLPNLEMLVFTNSGVSGTIPQKISLLTDLRHLLIGENNLGGTIPSDIAKMTSLESLHLDHMDGITGPLPTELGLMTSLTALEIAGDRLTGRIPSELGLMTSTARLLLWNNALDGSIPSELGLMTNIVDFRLGNVLEAEGPDNDFFGSVPNELWKLSHLQELFLANLPNLSGRIPSEMLMPNLTLLSLSGSPHVSGTIPEAFCSVEDLNIDCSNLLCGCYCPCISS